MFKFLLPLFLLLISCSSSAQSIDPATQKMLNDEQYCFGLASMANLSVFWRNSGKTLEEQLERRKKSFGSDTPEYLLLQDITKQIYDKDIKDPKVAIGDTHAACLDAKGYTNKFSQKAILLCPIIGVMVGEVAMARNKGATVEQVSSLLGNRYGDLPNTYEGGIEKLAGKYVENGKPDSGVFDNLLCMARGMIAK
jgi:hypothetical protein